MRRAHAEPISRVRTGCFTCRRRKKKCNEAKPVCAGCARNKLTCAWPTFLPGPSNSPSRSLLGENEQQQQSSSSSPRSPDSSVYPELVEPVPLTDLQPGSGGRLGPVRSSGGGGIFESAADGDDGMGVLPRSLSMLPGYGPECFQLLNHYLTTTADCMTNGSTPVNPFLVQVVPLAFSSDLLLQLVLTQSAAHRAFRSKRDVDDMANNHYTKALRLFRQEVTDFIDGKGSNPLLLTVGALMMCFTEVILGAKQNTPSLVTYNDPGYTDMSVDRKRRYERHRVQPLVRGELSIVATALAEQFRSPKRSRRLHHRVLYLHRHREHDFH